MSNVIVLSGGVQSGKTTALLKHFSKLNAVGGFFCPDVNGKRMMFFTSEKRVVPFQIAQQEVAVSIGKFSFDDDVFNKACDILVNPLTLDNDWIIIDEIGPLELKERGYYQSLVKFFEIAKQKKDVTILLVVREHLVDDVISKFNLSEAKIIAKEDLSSDSNLSTDVHGLILSGGESSRMQTDKFLLKYDGVEQYKRLLNMFDELNFKTFLSCNEKQYLDESVCMQKINDNAEYKDAGPLTGVLSAFDQLQSDLLIVGCDYPLLKIEHLRILKQFSEYGFDEIAFVKNNRNDVVEPLICFLSKQSLQKLKLFYQNGGRSLNKYLQQVNPLKIQLNDDSFLRSFDTPEDYHSYCNN
ncbi:MAG: putative bifunctional molybdopterin-guanine dinucleotide biosynthesis protein MobB/MobA [Bacteroidota bacterium]|jgi:molybdopterin-guanine dinucleotide biosynthesis protein A